MFASSSYTLPSLQRVHSELGRKPAPSERKKNTGTSLGVVEMAKLAQEKREVLGAGKARGHQPQPVHTDKVPRPDLHARAAL